MGARYATEQEFGGRKARVGDTVIICCPRHDICCPRHDEKPGTCLRAGMVVAVSSTNDRPWIVDVMHVANGPTLMMDFHETFTEGQIESMPVDAWTWPLQ